VAPRHDVGLCLLVDTMHGWMESDERQLDDHDRQVLEHVDRTCFFLLLTIPSISRKA